MAHNEPEEHGAAIKEFLSDWTPLTLEDRAAAFDDGPGLLFIDGDEYAERPAALLFQTLFQLSQTLLETIRVGT